MKAAGTAFCVHCTAKPLQAIDPSAGRHTCHGRSLLVCQSCGMKERSCSQNPAPDTLEPMEPAGLHPPHLTSHPGPRTGCEASKGSKQARASLLQRAVWHCVQALDTFGNFSAPSLPPTASRSPSCLHSDLPAGSSGVQANWALPFLSEEETKLCQESQDSWSGYHLCTFTLPMSKDQTGAPAQGDGQHSPFQAVWPLWRTPMPSKSFARLSLTHINPLLQF